MQQGRRTIVSPYGSEFHPVRQQTDVLCPKLRLRTQAKGQSPVSRPFQHPGGGRIIQVDGGHTAAVEQQELGLQISIHGPVKIQMILTQVRKAAYGEGHAFHPVQAQGMGGDLHYPIAAACVDHFPEQTLQIPGFRRGVHRVVLALPGDVPVGSDESHRRTGAGLQDAADQMGGGGLPVGSGHPHDLQLFRRPIQQICRKEPESFSAVFHPDEGAFRFRDLLAYHRRAPPLQGGRNVFMSVCLISPHRNEKGAGADFSAVITDVCDLQFRGSAQLQHRDVPQDFFQFHARVSMIDRSVSIRPTSITVPKATCSPGSRLWRCTSMVLESVGGTPEVRTNSPKASKYCTAAR